MRTRSDISKQIALNLCWLPSVIRTQDIYDLNKSSGQMTSWKCVSASPLGKKRTRSMRYLLKDEQRLPKLLLPPTSHFYILPVCVYTIVLWWTKISRCESTYKARIIESRKKYPHNATLSKCPSWCVQDRTHGSSKGKKSLKRVWLTLDDLS